jgi:hypothetical protein
MRRREFLFAAAASAVVPPSFGAAAVDAEADWRARIADPGVVWFHDFRDDTEVDNFRWTGGYRGGNDPRALGDGEAARVRRLASDGIAGTGGGCLEIVRPAGAHDGSCWWRPFSAIVGGTTTGNGRGAGRDDPGAGGTIAPQAYAPTDGGREIARWGSRGYYGNTAFRADAAPGTFDGEEYWLQARVKVDPNRIRGGNELTTVGKLFYFTRTDRSLSPQEIVTYSAKAIDKRNYFDMYRSGGAPLDQDPPGLESEGNQPRAGLDARHRCSFDGAAGRLANCWYWPAGEWATVMWHIRPGTNAGGKKPSSAGDPAGNHDTLIETWAAAPGERSFRQIWKQPRADVPWDLIGGHNALICSAYQNGAQMPLGFYQRYTQIIFSKNAIACPQA